MKKLPYILAATAFLLSAGVKPGEDETMKNKSYTVANSADEICPLLVGEQIPPVQLKTADGVDFDLNKSISQQPAVVIFYRGGWCPYCNMHLSELRTIEDELLELGYQLIAISADRVDKLNQSIEKHQLKYTLLSDNRSVASKAFGLAFKVGEDYVDMLKSHGMDIEDASGNKEHILPVPAAFLVGSDQIVKFQYVNPNYMIRVKAELLLAAAKAEMEAKKAGSN